MTVYNYHYGISILYDIQFDLFRNNHSSLLLFGKIIESATNKWKSIYYFVILYDFIYRPKKKQTLMTMPDFLMLF